MSEQGEARPRRALPPRDEEETDPVLEESDLPRRGVWSPTGSSPAAGSGTPIPPPAVLPPSETAPASAGRRFSAEDLGDHDERPLPRRSAMSPTASRALSPQSPASPGDAEPARGRRSVWISLAVVALILLGLGAAWFLLRPGGGFATPTPTPTVDPVATYLAQPGDLDGVRPGTTWTTAETATMVEAARPRPKCYAAPAEATPAPDTMVRTFAPSTGTAGGVLHMVEAYATPEEAAAAYTARRGQLATCEGTVGWVTTGLDVTGLGDEGTGVMLELQDAVPEHHTIVLWRTGTRVNVLDATQPSEAVDVTAYVGTLTGVASRQCTDNGTCPTTVAPTAVVPPPAEPVGWLASVDLPRITTAAGQWRGTAPVPEITVAGSRCEAIEFGTPPGAAAAEQRTYVLQDDTNAPEGFGVDEVLYTFSTPEEAAALAATLTANYDSCVQRTQTAEVTRTADLAAAEHSGTAWLITRRTDREAGTARFRTAVMTSGNRLAYLMLNPSSTFDYTDAQWQAVAYRAGERLTQLP